VKRTMNADQVFRVALLVAVLVMFPVALYHRLQARTGEKLDRRKEGLFILLTLRPIGIPLMLGVFAFLINPAAMAWSSMPLPAWLRWIGVSLCALADVLLIWTFRRLGKNLTDTVVTRREHTLVTQGPYRWVRHPFYDSVGLFAVGASLAAANWLMLASGVLVMALLVVRTRTEEAQLLARFGEPYQAYLDRTGRFLPRVL